MGPSNPFAVALTRLRAEIAQLMATMGLVHGVEVLSAASVVPIGLGVQTTVIVNRTGGSVTFHLPDGSDGLVKEIVNGGPQGGPHESTNPLVITSTNSAFGGGDALDLNASQSLRLVWVTSLGGWCVTNVCENVNLAWD